VPAAARSYVGIAAISMTLWVPVAWWMAQRSASAPGIGRIEFPVAASEHHAATESREPSDGTDAADSAAPNASTPASTDTAHH